VKPNAYRLIEQCVETGIELGLNRAHKHTDSPTREQLSEQIYRAVMIEVCEWFVFDDITNDRDRH
jgi:hypothetical protein